MTRQDIVDKLVQEGYRAEVVEEDYKIRVISRETIPDRIQAYIQAYSTSSVIFVVNDKDKIPIPSVLDKWVKQTEKYLK